MKTYIKTLFLVFTLGLVAFTVKNKKSEKLLVISESELEQNQTGITFPEDVKAIIDAKCMNCHKPEARNEKARKKLQWKKVPKMNQKEQESFLKELALVLEEGEMPPEKTIKRKPDMALTLEENRVLITWVEAEENRLKGK
ncbi:heme-binding domain-containing protein [Polaribacter gochangensis]|uniref:heme-binding domain-containing protein n=1 Tax=Polaribacter gochangensis TaxID=3252903 RepID=UPI003904BE64